MCFLETRCLKQESPELSKCFTSEGPSPASCPNEEPETEPPGQNPSGRCPLVSTRDMKPDTEGFKTSGQAAQRDNGVRDSCCHEFRKDPESRSPSTHHPSLSLPQTLSLEPDPVSLFRLRMATSVTGSCPLPHHPSSV